MKYMLALPYEIWQDIKGYEGLYQISNYGRVKSLGCYKRNGNGIFFQKGKILKPNINKKTGYLYVDLIKDGVRKHCTIHRLVAEAFKPNPNNYPTVDHINRIRDDNRADNLRWAPWDLQSDNKDNDCSKPIIQLTKELVFVAEYSSGLEAYKQTGISNCHISSCCNGKRPTAGGYVWRYK